MTYLESLVATHHMHWQHIWSELPMQVGWGLLETAAARKGGGGINYVARAGLRAMRELRERLDAEYEITDPERKTKNRRKK